MIAPALRPWLARGFYLASWIALLAGLVTMRSRAPSPETDAAPLPMASFAIAREADAPPLEITAAATGVARLALGLTLADLERDGEEITRRIEDGDLELRVLVDVAEASGTAPRRFDVPGPDLAILDSLHRDALPLLLVAEWKLAVEAGRNYRLAARVEGPDAGWLSSFRPLLLVAPRAERPPVLPDDPWPGAIALCGALGALIHLYVLLGRLVVPQREPLPDPGVLAAGGNIAPNRAVR